MVKYLHIYHVYSVRLLIPLQTSKLGEWCITSPTYDFLAMGLVVWSYALHPLKKGLQ